MTKSGVQNSSVVDLVTHDHKTDEFVVIMIETRPWDGSKERLLELQEKINNYLTFVLDGQMEKTYPISLRKAVRFQLDCTVHPDEETNQFISMVQQQLNRYEIKFNVNVLS